MPVPKQFFRSHNLIVTIAPPMVAGRPACPIPTVCPSGTCCGPPSRAFECYYSQLLPLPPELSPDDLRTILQEMRDKLKVEDRGLAILLGRSRTNGCGMAEGGRGPRLAPLHC